MKGPTPEALFVAFMLGGLIGLGLASLVEWLRGPPGGAPLPETFVDDFAENVAAAIFVRAREDVQ